MNDRVYLRPMALLDGPDAGQAVAAGRAGRLAAGTIAFTALEVIERRGAAVHREVRAYGDVRASAEAGFADRLEAIEAVRPDLPGLELSSPAVMGVVNVTPDSFSDGGRFADAASAVAQGEALAAAGADLLDVGGESTRPGSDATTVDEELRRVLPVIEGLARSKVPTSIDTRKAPVMRAAVEAGAALVNDVTALGHDPAGVETVRARGVPVMLMHSAGDPKTMQDNPTYDDVVLDVYDALAGRVSACTGAGIARDRIVVDPGIGFGKTFAHNHEILRNLSVFHGLGLRVALGVSRKAFIGALSGEQAAGRRLAGSLAAALVGVAQGVQILRVHDVAETVQAVRTQVGIWADRSV
ncbi:MAG: dihydropteroate synthase [Hyphomicrobiales bacterium]